MKKQLKTQAIYAASLLAISLSAVSAQAALTKVQTAPKAEQAIVDDEIQPEAPAAAEAPAAPVVAKKKTVVKKTVVVNEQAEITPPVEDVAAAPVPPAAQKPTTGQQLDEGVKAKMQDVQNQFEAALLKSLDRIKISVDDGTAPQGVSQPNQTQTIQDGLVGTSAAEDKNAYMSVKDAPDVQDEDAELSAKDGESVATLKEDKKSDRKIRVAPVFGKTNFNSSAYNISSHYTAGFELEMELEKNFALVFGYSYSQFDIGLASANPFYGYSC